MAIAESTMYWFRGLIYFATLTILYRRNPIYTGVEHIIAGALVGTEIVLSVETIQKGAVKAVELGDINAVIPILFGLMYFTFFIPQLRYLFRVATITTIAVQFGATMPRNFKGMYTTLTAYTRLESIGDALMIVMFVCCITYFIFMRKLEGPLRAPRWIGLMIIYVYAATQLAPNIFRGLDPSIGFLYQIFTRDVVIIPIIVFAGIVVDYLYRRSKRLAVVRVPGT